MDLKKISQFRATTKGELVFHYIVGHVIGRISMAEVYNLSMLQRGARQEDLSEYFVGVYCSNILRRALKKAGDIVKYNDDPAQHQRELVSYFLNTFEMVKGEKGVDLDQLAFLVLQAQKVTKKPISKSVKSRFDSKPIDQCYVCGKFVYIKGRESDKYNLMELEHIWPQCYGGDSIYENLLPSCHKCNKAKGDLLLWQNAHINKLIFKPSASDSEMSTLEYGLKVAQHRRMIFEYACAHRKKLKEAALEIGPVDMSQVQSIDGDDAIDFYNFKFV